MGVAMWGIAAWAHATLRSAKAEPAIEMRPSPRERGAPPVLGAMLWDCAHQGDRPRGGGRVMDRICARFPGKRPVNSSKAAFLAWVSEFPDVNLDELDDLYATISELSGWGDLDDAEPESVVVHEPQIAPAVSAGFSPPPFLRERKRRKDDAHADIISLLESGFTPESQIWLAERWGVTEGAVSRWITEWERASGVSMRRRMFGGRNQVTVTPLDEEEIPWTDLPRRAA